MGYEFQVSPVFLEWLCLEVIVSSTFCPFSEDREHATHTQIFFLGIITQVTSPAGVSECHRKATMSTSHVKMEQRVHNVTIVRNQQKSWRP